MRFRFGFRQRAGQFSRLLDDQGAAQSALDPDTAAMVEFVDRLRAAGGSGGGGGLSPDFQAGLRMRLIAVASVSSPGSTTSQPAHVRGTSWWLRPSRQRAATGVLAGVVAITGIGVAGERALPGDLFYGVKRAGEAVQLRTADGEADVALRHLLQAQARIDEVTALVERDAGNALGRQLVAAPTAGLAADSTAAGVNALVQQTLRDMDDDVRVGERLMIDAYAASGDRSLMELLNAWAGSQQPRLSGVAVVLPDVPQITISIALLEAVEQHAAESLAPPK